MAKRLKTLVIGVTGHRNIEEKSAALRSAVRDALTAAVAEYKPEEAVIISPLAEGADRLVAREVIALLGARLVVPLPVPQDSYEMDFAKSVGAFRKLLRNADDVFVIPLPKRSEGWRDYSPARNTQYARAGAYVAQHCHVLIAIWDGAPARGVGGTAHVVQWFRRGLARRTVAEVPAKCAIDNNGRLPIVRALRLIVVDPNGKVAPTLGVAQSGRHGGH